jgi:hypothetical protein
MSQAIGENLEKVADDMALTIIMLLLRGNTLKFGVEERSNAAKVMGRTVRIKLTIDPSGTWEFTAEPTTRGTA